MANKTYKLKLELPLQAEEYDVDVFNRNFGKLDAATPRTYISATEPPDWAECDIWLKVIDFQETNPQEVIIQTAPYNPTSQFFIDTGEGLQTITNAVSDPQMAQDGDIIIGI